MPTYSYRCPSCGQEFEKFQKISDATLAECPKCGSEGERVITGGAGIHFKGSGFYITDYKRAGEKKEEGPKPESKPKSEPSEKKPGIKPKSGADS
jgi:putative FmdB family regulatory protein